MSDLSFRLLDWLSPSPDENTEEATLASFRIDVNGAVATRVLDTSVRTVRDHINVPLYPVAHWLLVNWWRLRWESDGYSADWCESHSLAGLGGGYAWPDLRIVSDGEFVQLRLHPEQSPDAAGIQYLTSLRPETAEVPAAVFESSVDRFVDSVEGRVANLLPGERELSELREELSEERRDARVSTDCKLQALAGVDPGAASRDWIHEVHILSSAAGSRATEEMMAAAREPALAQKVVDAMRDHGTEIKLDFAKVSQPAAQPNERPWERGRRIAYELRTTLGLPEGPVGNQTIQDLVGASLFATDPMPAPQLFLGAFRNSDTRLLWPKRRVEGLRFYVARAIGAHCIAPDNEPVLPISDQRTATQKTVRAFAQEFLCPWAELDAFTDDRGMSAEGLMDAAEHFEVSDWLIRSTLVNRGKLPRSRLHHS